MVQLLRLHFWHWDKVQSLVEAIRSCMPCGAFKTKQNKKSTKANRNIKSCTYEMLPNYSRRIVLTQEERNKR